MNYTIATMKDIRSEYDWEIFFDRDRNKYTIGCRYLVDENYQYKHKTFENPKDALSFWNQQSANILAGAYSKEDRILQFN